MNFSIMNQDEQTLIQHQIELEKLFNKNQLIPRIRQEFTDCKDMSFTDYMAEKDIPEAFGMDLLTQMALHKRTTLPTLVGILRHHFDREPNTSQLTTNMILRCAEADLVDWAPAFKQFVVVFTISQDTQDEIDKYQFPLPMVVPPKEITTNNENGYLTSKGSVILKKNHHNEDVCLDHLNRVNKIKFSIDQDTAFMVRNQWRNLDKPKEGESKDDFKRRVRAFEKYDRTSKEVITHLLQYGNEFYLTHKYDKRGRIYCQGYHVNTQGQSWNKAVIHLADKELVE